MDARTFFIRLRSISERGVALISAMLIMMLMSALMIGFTTVVISDQRYRSLDKDRTRAFYAAHSGIEKLTSDLGTLFRLNVAPTAAQVAALSTNPPVITDVTYTAPGGIIGIIYRDAQHLKYAGNGALTAADTACNPYSKHMNDRKAKIKKSGRRARIELYVLYAYFLSVVAAGLFSCWLHSMLMALFSIFK